MEMTYPLGLLILAYNKVQWVERAVRAAMDQVCRPIEIILSDHGSTDGTKEILDRLAAEYEGPHKITRLDCPLRENRGMFGLCDHIAWGWDQTDCEAISTFSADDYALPGFALTVLRLLDEHPEAQIVATAMTFVEPGALEPDLSRVTAYQRTGWVTVQDCIDHMVGGSSQMAMRREFWEKVGPTPGFRSADVYFPVCAAAMGSFWYEYEPLYAYVQHLSEGNTGLGGVLGAQEDETARFQTYEKIQCQVGSSWLCALRKLSSLGIGSPEDVALLAFTAFNCFSAWHDVRLEMTMKRIQPMGFSI